MQSRIVLWPLYRDMYRIVTLLVIRSTIYDHIKLETFQMRITRLHCKARRESNDPVLVAHALAHTNTPSHAVTFIILYQSAK